MNGRRRQRRPELIVGTMLQFHVYKETTGLGAAEVPAISAGCLSWH